MTLFFLVLSSLWLLHLCVLLNFILPYPTLTYSSMVSASITNTNACQFLVWIKQSKMDSQQPENIRRRDSVCCYGSEYPYYCLLNRFASQNIFVTKLTDK